MAQYGNAGFVTRLNPALFLCCANYRLEVFKWHQRRKLVFELPAFTNVGFKLRKRRFAILRSLATRLTKQPARHSTAHELARHKGGLSNILMHERFACRKVSLSRLARLRLTRLKNDRFGHTFSGT